MSQFRILFKEEGREPGEWYDFETLDAAARFIKDRWPGVDYMDGPASFHTDYATYDLEGFTLRDIGKVLVNREEQCLEGFEFFIDHPLTVEDLYTFLAECGDTRSTDPEFLRVCSPVSKKEGWVVQLIWMHHDGDIPDASFNGPDLQVCYRQMKEYLVMRQVNRSLT